ncbi:30S ribosomal protein S1 [bacterium]|nr:MAG: 30S ribosomal protein S1 [bacterium]
MNNNLDPNWIEEIEKFPTAIKRDTLIKGVVTVVEPGRILLDVNYRSEGEILGPEIFTEGFREYPKVGEIVQIYVMNDGAYSGTPRLSIKKTGNVKVWENLEKARENGTEVTGVVIEVNTGGCMVALPGNIKGFLPASQLDQARFATLNTNRNDGISMQDKILEILRPLKGQKLKLGLLEADQKKQKILLSEKMLMESHSVGSDDRNSSSEMIDAARLSQQKTILENFKVGDVVEATVTGFAPFGIFVNSQGLEGLIHISQISWEKVEDVSNLYKIGDKIQVKVIAIDQATARVGFSVKMLEKDPWQSIKEKYNVGDVIAGKITKVVPYGAFVKIEDGVNGLIHNSEVSESSSAKAIDILQDGQDVSAIILHISVPDRQIALSIRNMMKKEVEQVGAEIQENANADSGNSNIDKSELINKDEDKDVKPKVRRSKKKSETENIDNVDNKE